MNRSDLKIIGAMLYVCEGTKARRDFRTKHGYTYSIELTNSDPKIIRIFNIFLKKIIKADWTRVRGQILTYPDLVENDLLKYWSKVADIPLSQFQKSITLGAKNGKFRPSPFGTFKVRYACKKDFLKMQSVIDDVWKRAGVI